MEQAKPKTYHEILQERIKEFTHLAYKVSRKFPKEELYGIASQFRRASISVALNYTEGYARIKDKVHKNFIEISFGSLKEVMFLINFCHEENFMTEDEFKKLSELTEEIAKMLWGMLRRMS
jgi:four helix bundle protein